MTELNELKQQLLQRISQQERMTFADYMAACLYEPGLGYYTSPGRKVGTAGDFYTSISVHAAYGRVLAREIARMWRLMGTPASFTLVECGAGHGRLACDIMDFLADREPEFYSSLNLVLIEQEPTLAEAQRTLLNRHAAKLSWQSPAALAKGEFRFSGCLYSNELIDALPVHRLIMTDQGLREIYVTSREDDFAEQHDEPSTPALADYLQRLGITLYPGQEAEINLTAVDWLQAAAQALQSGYLLTIDYGYHAPELFAPHRQHGTLLCYYRHQVEDNPYIRVGEQDITSHIDFTTLMQRGEEFGLTTEWCGEQYRFLLAAGIVAEIEEHEQSNVSAEDKLRLRLALKRLIMPEGGMGDTFKILVQSKGMAAAAKGGLLCQRPIGA